MPDHDEEKIDPIAGLREEMHELREQSKKSTSDRIWEISVKLLVPASIAFVGWCIHLSDRIEDHEIRLRLIEQTKFTDSDGYKLVNALRAEIRLTYPPEWLRQAVTRLETQNASMSTFLDNFDTRLDVRFDKVESRLASLEAKINK